MGRDLQQRNGDSPVLGPRIELGHLFRYGIHSPARLPVPPPEPGSHASENDACAVTHALRVRCDNALSPGKIQHRIVAITIETLHAANVSLAAANSDA